MSSATSISVHVNQTQGDVDVFIRYNALPSLIAYDYSDFSTQSSFDVNIVEPHVGPYYIGLFNFYSANAGYTMTVSAAVTCPMKCSQHGQCVGVTCECDEDWAGRACESLVYVKLCFPLCWRC